MATALQYLHDLAEKCGEYGSMTTTSVGTTTTLISSELLASNLSATSLENMAILLEDGAYAGEMRHVRPNGLTKTTGSLALAEAFSGAVASGVRFSAYARLPALRRAVGRGYLECINDALTRLWFEKTVSIAGVSGQQHYTVDADLYPWWTSADRIISIHRPVNDADDDPPMIPRSSWEWKTDGETNRLYFRGGSPANTGESFTVKLYCPANMRLRKSATAQATIDAGAVDAISVVLGGYYTVAPTVTISGGGGTGATATATLTGNTVTSIAVDAGGSGYTTVPTVTLSAGAWADQTSQDAGLLGIGDEAIPDLRDVTTTAKALVYRTLATNKAQGNTVEQWLSLAAVWERKAVALRHFFRATNPASGVPNLRPVLVGGRRSALGWGR